MNTELRWLPTAWEDKELVRTGPACRDLEDAKSWCQLQEDGDTPLDWLDLDFNSAPGGAPTPWGANGEDEVDYSIDPIDVEI